MYIENVTQPKLTALKANRESYSQKKSTFKLAGLTSLELQVSTATKLF